MSSDSSIPRTGLKGMAGDPKSSGPGIRASRLCRPRVTTLLKAERFDEVLSAQRKVATEIASFLRGLPSAAFNVLPTPPDLSQGSRKLLQLGTLVPASHRS